MRCCDWQAGPSITLAAAAETLAFALGGLTPMPAVRNFSLVAALAVLLDFFLQARPTAPGNLNYRQCTPIKIRLHMLQLNTEIDRLLCMDTSFQGSTAADSMLPSAPPPNRPTERHIVGSASPRAFTPA